MTDAKEAEILTADAICALVKDAGDKLNAVKERGRRDAWIFRHVLGHSEETDHRMWQFLKDVRTCPPEVIVYCRKVLEPKPQSAQERRNMLVNPSAFETRPIVSTRGCPSYSPNFDKFFICAKSGGVNCYLHGDLRWRLYAIDNGKPTGYFDTAAEASAALRAWRASQATA